MATTFEAILGILYAQNFYVDLSFVLTNYFEFVKAKDGISNFCTWTGFLCNELDKTTEMAKRTGPLIGTKTPWDDGHVSKKDGEAADIVVKARNAYGFNPEQMSTLYDHVKKFADEQRNKDFPKEDNDRTFF
jgi:hypothetical protein